MKPIIKFIKTLLRKSRAKKKPVDSSYVIPRSEHTISKTDINVNALKVLNRLNSGGFDAYLVGGSVRDLLLHKAPKDFDIATCATPNQIKRLFRNARIIGRRFKLVHILYHREIIEVATFRGHQSLDSNHQTNEQGMLVRDNVFGSMEEDAWRRDFTINSLYYNVEDASIVDFTGGVEDVHQRLIRIIGDPNTRYQEDPVRMLRAIRFAAKLHFDIEEKTEAPINELSSLILHVSSSRLFDEMTKLYQCGEAESAQHLLIKYGLFAQLFPQTHSLLESTYPVNAFLGIALENTDKRIRDNKPITPAFLFAVILWFPLLARTEELKKEGMEPLPALEKAMSQVLSEQNRLITIPKRFSQVIREMWIMQYRLPKRAGNRAYSLLKHPRFRAAYDFLALRALAGDESMELAEWWTAFQDADDEKQKNMVEEVTSSSTRKRRRRKKRKAP